MAWNHFYNFNFDFCNSDICNDPFQLRKMQFVGSWFSIGSGLDVIHSDFEQHMEQRKHSVVHYFDVGVGIGVDFTGNLLEQILPRELSDLGLRRAKLQDCFRRNFVERNGKQLHQSQKTHTKSRNWR